MKKIKLFLAAMAAMVTMGANAQDWIASEVGAGNFHLYNVGKGQFLTRNNGWQTQASTGASALTLTVEEYDGAYKLRTNVNGDGKGLERLADPVIYTDQSASKNSTWTFTKVADGSNGPIYTIVSKDNHNGGAGSYMMASADNTIVGPADAVTDDYGRWQLIQSWITNTMPVTNADGWTVSQTPTYDGGNICAEYWNASGASIKQTVSNLPAGGYELIAVALTRTGMTATLKAGTNTMSIATVGSGEVNNRTQAKTWFDNGNGVNKLEFTHAGGSLEIGLTADNANGDHWLVWRSFILLYKGLDLSELKAALQAQIDAVPALEGTTTTAAYNAAKNYADGIDMDALTTEEAISTASTELANLVNAATALQTDYTRYNAIKTAAKAWETQTTVYTGDATVDTSEADAAVEAATTVDGVNSAITTLRAAAATFLGAVTINENACFDITAVFLTNADFSNGTIGGWDTNYVSGQQANNIGYQGSSYSNGSVTISQFIEAWRWSPALGDGYLSQTVSGLPEGKYTLEADAIAADQPGGTMPTGAYLFINAADVDYKTTMATADGKPQHFTTEFLSPGDVAVTFGMKTESTTANWIGADNFTVKFYGIDLSPYATLLAEAVTEAQAVDALTTTTAAINAINNAINTYNKPWSTSQEYTTAIAAIQAAANDAKALQSPVAEYNALKTKVEAMKNVQAYTETTNGATTTLTSAIATADEAVAAATTALAIEEQAAAVKAAGKTFLGGVRSDGEHPFDITFLITNASFDNNDATGWTAEPAPGFQSFTNCEYYQKEFDINQTLTDMPKGNYELKVQAFQRPGVWADVYAAYQAGTDNVSSVIYINDGQTTIKNLVSEGATDANHQWQNGNDSNDGTVYFANSMQGAAAAFAAGYYWNTVLTSVEGSLKFGFKSTKNHVAGDWTIFDNFQLFFYGNSINVAMSETEPFAALADIEGANVTMARTSKVGYNTVALPFDLTATQVQSVFGDGAVVYAFSEDSADPNDATVNFNTKSTQTIEANVPVLVNATAAATQIVANDVTVKTGAAKVEGTNFDFVGNYGGQITLADGIWFVGNGALYKSAGTTTMKGFRAYIEPKTATSNPVKLYIDGLETAIEEINGETAKDAVIYNLAGQRVNKAQKGIYIQNGKKVLVK